MPVRRNFQRQLNDLPDVGFPDWELYSKIESLFSAYTPESRRFEIQGTDRRGNFSADDLMSFREELEAREDELTALSIEAWAFEPEEASRRFVVHFVPGQLGFARVSSEDEIVASGMAERLRDLFFAANRRLHGVQHPPISPAPAGEVRSESGLGLLEVRRQDKLAALAAALRHPIISGLIVGLILLAVGLWVGLR